MDTMTFHDMTLNWLEGGVVSFDGGAIFGVVPKGLWTRKYPVNDKNQIENATDPILILYKDKRILIDSGIGQGKFTEKQKRNFGVREESKVADQLKTLDLKPEDIDMILMTHMHFDHASGLTRYENDQLVSVFPNAAIYVNEIEWNEMRQPNSRSKSTYWKENWEAIQEQVIPYSQSIEPIEGIEMSHTGGHSAGHAIIKLKQQGDTLIHMADIMPTHAHQNPLWVMAYDDYPMDSIVKKEQLMTEAYENQYGFIFYHDAYYRMIKWDESGQDMIKSIERSKKKYIN
ncbi:YtnP family quorum-quenching lactonase [Alkalibacterium sp. MB6]|uniref:YtnP family quorum-quenching lactonase n=1 Tax=Alkalibacterium sp. MB6 TaxID=2081965 RepID=UPI00137B4920|nr:MBL fold metallo-hydrolase [Alkalibacterium sp. MB6]